MRTGTRRGGGGGAGGGGEEKAEGAAQRVGDGEGGVRGGRGPRVLPRERRARPLLGPGDRHIPHRVLPDSARRAAVSGGGGRGSGAVVARWRRGGAVRYRSSRLHSFVRFCSRALLFALRLSLSSRSFSRLSFRARAEMEPQTTQTKPGAAPRSRDAVSRPPRGGSLQFAGAFARAFAPFARAGVLLRLHRLALSRTRPEHDDFHLRARAARRPPLPPPSHP